jgi:hypothetical protein
LPKGSFECSAAKQKWGEITVPARENLSVNKNRTKDEETLELPGEKHPRRRERHFEYRETSPPALETTVRIYMFIVHQPKQTGIALTSFEATNWSRNLNPASEQVGKRGKSTEEQDPQGERGDKYAEFPPVESHCGY